MDLLRAAPVRSMIRDVRAAHPTVQSQIMSQSSNKGSKWNKCSFCKHDGEYDLEKRVACAMSRPRGCQPTEIMVRALRSVIYDNTGPRELQTLDMNPSLGEWGPCCPSFYCSMSESRCCFSGKRHSSHLPSRLCE